MKQGARLGLWDAELVEEFFSMLRERKVA
jgi:hypothetical protein